MINYPISSLVENSDHRENTSRKKRQFSDMMKISLNISSKEIRMNSQDCKNYPINYYDDNEETAKYSKFQMKMRKIVDSFKINDYLYKIEDEFKNLKIHKNDKFDINTHLSLDDAHLYEFKTDKENLNSSANSDSPIRNRKNSDSFIMKKRNLISSKEENLSLFYKEKEKRNIKKNNDINKNLNIKSSEYIDKIDDKYFPSIQNEMQILQENYIDNQHYIPIEEYELTPIYFNKNADPSKVEDKNYIKNKNYSFYDNIIEIDINDLKNQPNNNDFYNSNIHDMETINTSRNTNIIDDLSFSFLTKYSNNNVIGNLINNAIESEKLMMKLFDTCNPLLQPNERNVIILYSDMQKLKNKIRAILKKIQTQNIGFSPMDLDFFNLMNNNASFSQIYSNIVNHITNEDEIMNDNNLNCDNIDDNYDFSMIID